MPYRHDSRKNKDSGRALCKIWQEFFVSNKKYVPIGTLLYG